MTQKNNKGYFSACCWRRFCWLWVCWASWCFIMSWSGEVVPAAFLGYASETYYTGTLTVDESWLPDQLQTLGSAEQQTFVLSPKGACRGFLPIWFTMKIA